MKKKYERPVLDRKGKLSAIVALTSLPVLK